MTVTCWYSDGDSHGDMPLTVIDTVMVAVMGMVVVVTTVTVMLTCR